VWAGVDFAVTRQPLYSLTATGDLADELGRNKGVEAVPGALYAFLIKLAKFPVFLGGAAGLAIAILLTPRRAAMPLALFAAGVGTFTMVGVAGLSVIDRYLLVPSLCVMVFAAVSIAGWTMLREGTWARRIWTVGAGALVVFGIVFTVTSVNLNQLDNELRFRGDAHHALEEVLSAPAVASSLRCGPVYVPNHKLIPDVRWILDRSKSGVLARSSAKVGEPRHGVVLLVHTRIALFKQALVTAKDDPVDNLPPANFVRAATSQHYAAYVRC
jgi:hypothetical protein